ncbi:hypothetical protein F5Y04DRAFT_279018 [Hypomontagnella monticulosa]|nr:hypothetical protein F5Y04DRAFT_279018 [Hypomontagnella monticulosa]
MAPTLETLPIIVVERICEYLAQDDPTLRTLHSFSFVSRYCCSVAEKQRFSQINLIVPGSDELQDKMELLDTLLSIGNRVHYVRRFKVSLVSRGTVAKSTAMVEGDDNQVRDVHFDVHPFCQPHTNVPYDSECIIRGEEHVTAFAHFISRLSRLRDFVWADMPHMPPPILSAIHAIGCRLHVHMLPLNCVVPGTDQPGFADPDQFALVTSPSLYSVVALFRSLGGADKHSSTNQEALRRMIAGAAPNLAHVQLRDYDWDWEDTLNTARLNFLPETPAGVESKLGALRSLVIDTVPMDENPTVALRYSQLKDFARCTNFSELRTLAIDCENDFDDLNGGEAVPYLAEAAKSGVFRSLNTLTLAMRPDIFVGEEIEDRMVLLLENLQPLQTLDLAGFVSKKMFDTAIRHHGEALRKLRIRPRRWNRENSPRIAFSEPVIRRLADQCPRLEQLEIPINRTQGNAHETRTYRALSRLPRLTCVILILETLLETIQGDGEEVVDLWDDREAYNIRPGYEDMPFKIRGALINVAIDASLARSIYDTISPDGRLDRLELWSSEKWGQVDYERGLTTLLDWIRRSWFIEKDYRGELSVRETYWPEKAYEKAYEEAHEERVKELTFGGYWLVWNEVWPQTGPDWWRHWKSFPLSED